MDLETEVKTNNVAESFEIMGFKLMADMVRASKGLDLRGYAQMCKTEAIKRGETFIAEKMELI